jgi:hypothetical protein
MNPGRIEGDAEKKLAVTIAWRIELDESKKIVEREKKSIRRSQFPV